MVSGYPVNSNGSKTLRAMVLRVWGLLQVLLIPGSILFAQYDSIYHGGYHRTFLLHLPDGYSGLDTLPLVVAMHGGTGSAYNLQNQSELSKKADAEYFMVVYPEGVKGGLLNVRAWNAGWCCGYASYSQVDDVGFIDALLDTLIRRYPVDVQRIYATGMSNGGFMAYRLACELSGRIAAIAPVSASMSMSSCNPERTVPVIHIHSYLDSSVPYKGGVGDGISGHYNPPLDSVLSVWAGLDGCMVLRDTLQDDEQFTHVKWTSCDCGSEINYYITRDGGHSWPGGTQTPVGDPPSAFLNANDLMWSFFQQHTLACSGSSGARNAQSSSRVTVYPNPASGTLMLKIPESHLDYTVTVRNPSGTIISASENQREISLASWFPGVYLIEIRSDRWAETHKVVFRHPADR